MLDLTTILDAPLEATLKGLAPAAVGRPLRDLGALGLSVFDDDLPFPIALLKQSALAHNARWMQDFADGAGVSLCPHGKTTMAPQLFDRQLEAGAWGMTAATASHVRTYRRFGVRRIVLANQLVGRTNIDLVFDELDRDDTFEFFALVDSVASLDILCDAVDRRPLRRPLNVLLEVGITGGRTGVRSRADGIALAKRIHDAAPAIALRGIETFEGASMASGTDAEAVAQGMLGIVVALGRQGIAEGWFAQGEILLTAGGSAFFDIVARALGPLANDRVRAVLRSGCYLSHDALHYERMQPRIRERAGPLVGDGPGLVNALEVWSAVQSVPEPCRAIVALGKRDVSHDLEPPQPLRWIRPKPDA